MSRGGVTLDSALEGRFDPWWCEPAPLVVVLADHRGAEWPRTEAALALAGSAGRVLAGRARRSCVLEANTAAHTSRALESFRVALAPGGTVAWVSELGGRVRHRPGANLSAVLWGWGAATPERVEAAAASLSHHCGLLVIDAHPDDLGAGSLHRWAPQRVVVVAAGDDEGAVRARALCRRVEDLGVAAGRVVVLLAQGGARARSSERALARYRVLRYSPPVTMLGDDGHVSIDGGWPARRLAAVAGRVVGELVGAGPGCRSVAGGSGAAAELLAVLEGRLRDWPGLCDEDTAALQRWARRRFGADSADSACEVLACLVREEGPVTLGDVARLADIAGLATSWRH